MLAFVVHFFTAPMYAFYSTRAVRDKWRLQFAFSLPLSSTWTTGTNMESPRLSDDKTEVQPYQAPFLESFIKFKKRK